MRLSLVILAAFVLVSCNTLKDSDNQSEVYQNGSDQYATWAYLGYVPRVQDPERIRIVISKKGYTLRVTLRLNAAEVADYAKYLVDKADEFLLAQQGRMDIRWGSYNFKEPFSVSETPQDQVHYRNYYQQVAAIRQYVGAGYAANLKLMEQLLPGNVFLTNDAVILHFVYPITIAAAGVNSIPFPGNYNIYSFEERRTKYAGGGYIFAGFPALWFSGDGKGVGIHGPIRYSETSDNRDALAGEYSDHSDISRVVAEKRWQLVRKADSHGCIRTEHTFEIRHLLPAELTASHSQPLLMRDRIVRVITDYDWLDVNNDGVSELLGVKYYWVSPYQNTSRKADGTVAQWRLRMEQEWKKTYYKDVYNKLSAVLYEFAYRDPNIVQLSLSRQDQMRSDAVTAYLNRLPLSWLK